MSTQKPRAVRSLLGGSELGEELATSAQQQQQQLVDVAPGMNAIRDRQQAFSGGGEVDDGLLRREDGSHGEVGLMNTQVGGQATERRPWSRSEDEAITRLVVERGTDEWSLIAGKLCAEIPGALRTAKDCGTRWFHHLDPSLREQPWTESEDQVLRDAQLRMGDRWGDIANLLPGRTENCVKSHWYATLQNKKQKKKNVPRGNNLNDDGLGGAGMGGGGGDDDDDGNGGGETGGGSATPRPGGCGGGGGGGSNDGEGDYGSFALDVVPGGGGGGGVCSPVGRAGGPGSPLPPSAAKMRVVGSFSAAHHVGPCAPAALAVQAGASPALVPLSSSFPLGASASASSSVEGLGRWQVSDDQPLVGQSVIGSLTRKETATLQTAYEELNKKLEGNSTRVGGSARSMALVSGAEANDGSVGVGAEAAAAAAAPAPPMGAAEAQTPFQGKGQASFDRVAASAHTTSSETLPPPLPAPASSVGSQGGGDSVTGKRPRPRLFVNTNVDPGMYIGHDPHGSEGANAASAAIAAARSAARAASRISHTSSSSSSSLPYGCPPGVGSSTAAAASAAAEAAARYAGGMGNVVNQPMAPMHHHRPPPHHPHLHHHQQQQQQQLQHQHMASVARRGRGRVGGGGAGSDYPIAIPGTSVRRYMHVQLLLALMSAPGLKVVAPAKVSWDRLGYYPVDAVFGPPGPGPPPTSPPRLTPTVLPPISASSPTLLPDLESPAPPKRARSVKGPGLDGGSSSVHDAMGLEGGLGVTNTGAMAMPPPQHSPRTSAMLSGLPVGAENAMMLGEPGDFQASPTSLIGMGGLGPMSPYQFPLTSGGGIGGILSGGRGSDGNGSSDGSASGGDPSQHFDFAAAMGGMVPNYNFADFASIYSPNPVSPTFGSSRLSPLAGALSPQSLSPRGASWATGFHEFSS